MADIKKLIDVLFDHSLKIKEGEWLLIEGTGTCALPLMEELMHEAHKRGVRPFYRISDGRLNEVYIRSADEEMLKTDQQAQLTLMEKIDCWIGIRGIENIYALKNVDEKSLLLYNQMITEPVHLNVRTKKRWVLLNYPSPSLAQSTKMTTREYEELWLKSSALNYSRLRELAAPLEELFEKTDQVHIKSSRMDFKLSISGMPYELCVGEKNIPDGEIFTAPVLDTPSGEYFCQATNFHSGNEWSGIRFKFEKGKVVEIDCETGNVNKLRRLIFDTPGAQYIGEFALGFNPYIRNPSADGLFTEKVAGSFHTALGNSYEDCGNGNKSPIHWDIVNILTPEFGGGEIYFDGVLIQKDGKFVLPELEVLNPDKLVVELEK